MGTKLKMVIRNYLVRIRNYPLLHKFGNYFDCLSQVIISEVSLDANVSESTEHSVLTLSVVFLFCVLFAVYAGRSAAINREEETKDEGSFSDQI